MLLAETKARLITLTSTLIIPHVTQKPTSVIVVLYTFQCDLKFIQYFIDKFKRHEINAIKPDSHMSPIVGDAFWTIIRDHWSRK